MCFMFGASAELVRRALAGEAEKIRACPADDCGTGHASCGGLTSVAAEHPIAQQEEPPGRPSTDDVAEVNA